MCARGSPGRAVVRARGSHLIARCLAPRNVHQTRLLVAAPNVRQAVTALSRRKHRVSLSLSIKPPTHPPAFDSPFIHIPPDIRGRIMVLSDILSQDIPHGTTAPTGCPFASGFCAGAACACRPCGMPRTGYPEERPLQPRLLRPTSRLQDWSRSFWTPPPPSPSGSRIVGQYSPTDGRLC